MGRFTWDQSATKGGGGGVGVIGVRVEILWQPYLPEQS